MSVRERVNFNFKVIIVWFPSGPVKIPFSSPAEFHELMDIFATKDSIIRVEVV